MKPMKLSRKSVNCKVDRTKRVAALLQQELGRYLSQKAGNPLFRRVAIVHVMVTPNLKKATIFIASSVSKDKKTILSSLNKASSYFRCLLAEALSLRYVPELVFLGKEKVNKSKSPETTVINLMQEIA